MKHRAEHQRNIAFDLIRIRNMGGDIADYFVENEPIIIYGLDFLAKEIFSLVREKANVVCFIDRSHDREIFQGIPVYSLDNSQIQDVVNLYSDIKVVITIMHDWKTIEKEVASKLKNAVPVSIYNITSWIKLNRMEIFKGKQRLARDIIGEIVEDRETDINKIVLVGTAYTDLLSMLMLSEWENTLYIAERFFPKKVVDKLAEYNIPCFYEEEAGEFYDICYVIAEYAQKRNISIYGHDHMLLSQAFLENSISVIEDGDVNYKAERAKKYIRILDDNYVYYPFGYSDYVKEVILTDMMDIPQEISQKVVKINPAELWTLKTEKEKKELSDIFLFPYSEIINLVNEGKTILFLTEPYTKLKGRKSIAVEKQISLFKEILASYDSEKVIIKPHPSDDVDYEKLMPEYSVIPKQFPIQMLKWTRIKLEKIVMLWGHTCMYTFQDEYEIDVYKDILEKYGIVF
ncbi:MAG: hypothetical protein IJ326_08655 [Lachnospiraceae bacterium]|nr:hypothetical protein [Lachnospiraceae bacterium]